MKKPVGICAENPIEISTGNSARIPGEFEAVADQI